MPNSLEFQFITVGVNILRVAILCAYYVHCLFPRTCGIGCEQPAFLDRSIISALPNTSTFHKNFFLWMCFVFERTLDPAFWFISIDFFGILSQIISVIYFFTSLKTFALICFPFYKTDDIPLNHSPTSVLINFSFKKN